MSESLSEFVKRARELSAEERAQLVQELLESIDSEADPDVQAAWDSEIERRIRSYERGEAILIPAEEVFAKARKLLT